MAKRILLGLLILAAFSGVLCAQEAKMAISLDLFPLAKGIIWSDSDKKNSAIALAPGFEYLVRPHFTVGAAVDLCFGEVGHTDNLGNAVGVDILYFGLAAHGRWYPQSTGLDKLFIDAGLGFNMFSLDGETDPDKGGFTGLTMSLKTGYKLMFTPNFFAEPSMAFVYAKTPSSVSVPVTPLGWQPSLSIGAAF
jgi:hypothetical protein